MGAWFANGWALAMALALGTPRAEPRLRVEYLPHIVYEDEAITACVCVEGRGALTVGARLLDRAGRPVASGTARCRSPRVQFDLRPKGREPTRLDLSLFREGAEKPVARVEVRVVNLTRPLPPLEVKGLRLTDEKGRPVVVRIAHRVRRVEQRWPLVRWIRHKLYGDRVAFDHVAVVGEDLGAARDGYLAMLSRTLRDLKVSVVSVPSGSREKGPVVLRAVAAASRRTWREPPGLVVLSLGHSEDDLGTDPLVFGRGLEALIQHFERVGSRHFVLLAPVGPPAHSRRLTKYAAETRRVAHTYQSRYADVRGVVTGCWGLGTASATRRFPNVEGHRRLAAALADFVRALRR